MTAEAGHAPNRWYADQSGNIHMNGASLFDSAEGNILSRNSGQPSSVTITNAASTSNISLVTFQVVDAAGTALTGPTTMVIHLSDLANGSALTAQTASGAVAAGASGTDLAALVSKKAIHVLTDATGKYILSITDSGKNLFVPVATIAGLKSFPGAALTAGSYG